MTLDLTAIRLQLGCQAAADAAAGGGAVLDAFWYRLADMVGPPLTEELIGSVWSRVLNNGAETAGEV